jgi:serine/threonine protein kinase/tetratricopeptide (TPR) repeat protein
MSRENPAPTALDDFIDAYEACQARDGVADLADFLPPRDCALYPRILRELVRIDLELGWSRGKPRSLDEYRRLFPDLSHDPEAMQEIAFEEYRLRRQAGQAPAPAEYRERYGVDTTNWPVSAVPSWRADAAHSPRGGGHADGLDSWGDSGALAVPLDVLRQVRHSDPELAFLLAQTLTSLPEMGSTFLGFHLVAELGRGAFGRVYLAEQGDLANRLVALKITVGLPGESQTLAQLQHTNIVPIYSTHRAGAFQAVCMPYFGPATLLDVLEALRARGQPPASGRDLVAALRQRGGQFPRPTGGEAKATLRLLEGMSYVEAVLWIAARVADGLAHAHEHGIVHQDLKPANILLTAEGQPMLLDFNLSADTKRGASAAHVGGTLPYMAPERPAAFASGERPADARSDLYALGVILFELLTGRLPFAARRGPVAEVLAQVTAERRQPVPRLRRWNRAVPVAVESIVRRLLAPDPARRYGCVRDLREDLDCQLNSLPLRHAPDHSIRERLGKWLRRHPRLASRYTVCFLGLAVVAGLLAALGWQQSADLGQTKAQLNQTEATLNQTEATLSTARAELEATRKKAAETLLQFQGAFSVARAHAVEIRDIQFAFDSGLLKPERPSEIARCREALDRYRVLEDAAWQEAAEVRYLPAREQEQLRRDVGELLYLLARAVLFGAVSPGSVALCDPSRYALPLGGPSLAPLDAAAAAVEAQWRYARRLNELALSCSPETEQPLALVLQQLVLAGLTKSEAEVRRLQEKANGMQPRTPRDSYLAAEEYTARGDYDRALPLAEKARRDQPTQAAAWFLEGLCHEQRGDPNRAARCFDTCLDLRPDLILARSHRGLASLKRGDWAAAEADFTAVLGAQPELGSAYFCRAEAREKRGQIAGALEDLSKALQCLPAARCEIFYRRAALRRQARDIQGAADDEAELLRSEPTDARGWTCRGLARAAAHPEAALADYDKALELDPRCLSALSEKAKVLARLSADFAAVKCLDRAVGYYPTDTALRLERALMLMRLGRWEAAHEDAEAALARDASPETLYEAGCIFTQTARQDPRDRRRALELLSAAVRKGYRGDGLVRDPRLYPLRGDPAFEEFLQAVHTLDAMAR